jgi:dCMP deaminase
MEWSKYFFDLVTVIKTKSKDPSTKVGCVIVGPYNEIISTGFNGIPRLVNESPERFERPAKYMYTEHAERNAIYLAARRGVSLDGARIYLSWYPCAECARAIIQSGICEVYIDNTRCEDNPEANERWGENFKAALIMLNEAKIPIYVI